MSDGIIAILILVIILVVAAVIIGSPDIITQSTSFGIGGLNFTTRYNKDKITGVNLSNNGRNVLNFSGGKPEPADSQIGIRSQWYKAIKSGHKTVEGRLDRGRWAQIKVGDIIEWRNVCDPDTAVIKCIATRVHLYPSAKNYLEGEGMEKTLPGLTLAEGRDLYAKNYPQKDEEEYGIKAIEFKKN